MASREIIEDQLFTHQIARLRVNWKRLDEAMMTMYPALQNSPELFPRVPGTKLHRMKLVGFQGVPPLSIFFTISPTQIVIKAAELIDLEE